MEGLNCLNCTKAQSETKKKPACFTGDCPIQDIQECEDSYRINAIVNAFIVVEGLTHSPGYQRLQEKTVKESGLENLDPGTIFKMKEIYSAYCEKKRKEATK